MLLGNHLVMGNRGEEGQPVYFEDGLAAVKFVKGDYLGVFIRLNLTCAACGHRQKYETTGFFLGRDRSLEAAAKLILRELFDDPGQRTDRTDCHQCGQISLLVPHLQKRHVEQWILSNLTPEWLATAKISEPPANTSGICLN